MNRIIAVTCLVFSLSLGQRNPQDAKILREQRFNAGDGRFGAAFAQEDGTVFREETSADGERVGQYSYIDENGKTVTVRYTAGKDGFRILEGDHVPEGANGLTSASFDPDVAANTLQTTPQQAVPAQQPASIPRRNVQQVARQQVRPASTFTQQQQRPALPAQQPASVPRRNLQQVARQQVRPASTFTQQQQRPALPTQPDSNFNPFINPADPSHFNLQVNTNATEYNGGQRQTVLQNRQQFSGAQQNFAVPSVNNVPACADCEGFNPFVNPADFSLQQIPQQQQRFRAPAQQSSQRVSQFNGQPQQNFQPAFTANFQPAATAPTAKAV